MATEKQWVDLALQFLEKSLSPLPHELNELDWKTDISSKSTPNLAKHISAFANTIHGGYLVFGIDDHGQINGVNQKKIKDIISKVNSIAREGVDPKTSIDHAVKTYKEKTLLFIYIKESKEKPVHLRGKGLEESYIRSGASTHKMSKQEIGWCLLKSKVPSFEEQDADTPAPVSEVLNKIDVTAFFNLLKIPLPGNVDTTIQKLEEYSLVKPENRQYVINNLGVLLAAQNMSHFSGHARRGVRVICYKSSSKVEAVKDKTFERGYAVGFNEILDYIQEQLPGSEVIRNAFREKVTIYPIVAIRELLANAIIHQDFSIDSTHPKVEIFSDRIEITNPGTLITKTSIDRLFGSTNPRNELFARIMYKTHICEDRGSGLIRALISIELCGLPPLKFEITDVAFKVILYAPRNYQDMSKQERVDACFQHCILKYLSNEKMTNSSLRKRLGISEKNYALASRIIKDTLDQNKIKIANPEIKNAKYIHYVPSYI
ncbi:MAG: putative DNA binding domain-containing protein [Proteobacteria bacterium]|nr:putative DNA binding domain-containing protein [Pseudomonadota bacterium]